MMYDRERAPQPQDESPDLVKQDGPHAPRTEPARPSHEPVIGTHDPARAPGSTLLPQGERDKLTMRLQQALNSFVDSPRQAVEEADSVFDEAVTHLTGTLTERLRVLRASWRGPDTEAQTEALRLALRQYREATERLLRI